jgi:hypothetical protein
MITPLSRAHLPPLHTLLAQHAARWALPAPADQLALPGTPWAVVGLGNGTHNRQA